MTLHPKDLLDYTDYDSVRGNLFDSVQRAVTEAFPIENERFALSVENLHYTGPERYSRTDEKRAKLQEKSLTRRLAGSWRIVDKQTGKAVVTRPRTLINVPYLTSLGTFLRNGVEHTVSKQFRLRPGAYTRQTDDDRVETQFNPKSRTGAAFRIYMDPATSLFYLKRGTNNVPLYPVFHAMGIPDEALEQRWGKEILDTNRQQANRPHALHWIKTQIAEPEVPREPEVAEDALDTAEQDKEAVETTEAQRARLLELFGKVELDPMVTEETLGKPYQHATPEAMLDSTSRILQVARREADPDDRDSLRYQTVHDVGDFLADKIRNDQDGALRRLLWKVTGRQGAVESIPPSVLDKHVQHLFTKSGLAQVLEEVNPLEVFDQNQKIQRMGEGALATLDSVPKEARNINPSYLGYIDAIRSPESLRIGVDMRLARNVRKGKDNLLYTQFVAPDGKRQWIDQRTASRSVIGFASSRTAAERFVPAMQAGQIGYVDRSKIDFFVENGDDEFSYGANLVPLKSGDKAMRLSMGSKFSVAALPLVRREAPLVRTVDPDHGSTEAFVGRFMGTATAGKPGVVTGVYADHIKVRNDDGSTSTYDLFVNHPFSSKTFARSMPQVKAGAKVKAGQLLASSNYTDNEGNVALGRNLRVAYATYHGKNFEDAVVVSESAAKALTSEHLFHEKIQKSPDLTLDRRRYLQNFPTRFSPAQMKTIDDTGMVKPGTMVRYGDPLMLAFHERDASALSMGRRLRADAASVWKHQFPALVTSVVTDTAEGKKTYGVYVRANVPLEVGDKLASRHGGKGVVAEVVPDELMMKDAKGNPLDIVLAPEGLISRVNPGQLIETLLGKVAAKTGKPYVLPGFSDENMADYAQQELRKHRLSPEEDVFDPVLKKTIPGVLTGSQYFYKLQQTAEGKGKSRSTAGYTAEGQPARGGKLGSKHLGDMELGALLGHGANALIKDYKLIKGQENTDFWRQLKLGHSPAMPGVPLIYEKFKDLIRASGVELREEPGADNIFAMTNQKVKELTRNRQIQSSATYSAKEMRPISGGLFDPHATAGDGKGDLWSYIQLPEPMLNPIMEEPVRSLLGLKQKELREILYGRKEIDGKTGGEALKQMLSRVDLENVRRQASEEIRSGAVSKRDAAVKRYQYAAALQKQKVRPEDFLWERVPVLPPRFRPIVSGDQLMVSDPNYLYKALIDSTKDFAEIKSEKLPAEQLQQAREVMAGNLRALIGLADPVQPELQNKNVGGILQQLLGKGSPKYSLVQRRVVGTNIDMSGLGVITPNPSLKLNEVGLPEERAWELYKPFIVRYLVRKGLPATEAARAVAEHKPGAYEALQAVIKERPVIINRAPTLHKYSMLAAWPRLTKGHTLQISPSIVKPFGADFDGNCVDFDTKINIEISKTALDKYAFECSGMSNSQNRELLMPTVEQVVVAKQGYYTIKIGEFPRFGAPVKDKNGADVYTVPDGFRVLSLDPNTGMPAYFPITHFTVEAACPCVSVRAGNHEAVVSANESLAVFDHALGVLVKEAPAKALGKYVAAVRSPETWGIAGCAEFGWWLGMFASDGWLTGKQLGLAKAEDAKREAFVDITRKHISTNFHVAQYAETVTRGSEYKLASSKKLHMFGPELAQFVRSLRLVHEDDSAEPSRQALRKQLPASLLDGLSRSALLGIFAGLIDGDGSMSRNTAMNKVRYSLRFYTSSVFLRDSILDLLFRLGVEASCTTTMPSAKRLQKVPSFTICPSVTDTHWLLPELRFVGAYERAIQKQWLAEYVPADTASKDVIPLTFEEAQIIRQQAYAEKAMGVYSAVAPKRCQSGGTPHIQRGALRAWLDEPAHAHPVLAGIERRFNARWVQVQVVTDAGSREVFDFDVPGAKVFAVNNGLIIWDTMSYSVPVSAEAVEEAKARMLPERVLLSERLNQPNFMPGNEYVKGLYLATKTPSARPVRRFASREAALRAYRNGEIMVDDPISIG